jgi:hypothetical protein
MLHSKVHKCVKTSVKSSESHLLLYLSIKEMIKLTTAIIVK